MNILILDPSLYGMKCLQTDEVVDYCLQVVFKRINVSILYSSKHVWIYFEGIDCQIYWK